MGAFRVDCNYGIYGILCIDNITSVEMLIDYITKNPTKWLKGKSIYLENDPEYWIKLSSIVKITTLGR